MKELFIHGYSHCGTTMLPSLLSQLNNVDKIGGERDVVPDDFRTDKKWVVYKNPWTFDHYLDEGDGRQKIFLIRNPAWVISSYNRRLAGKKCEFLNEEKYEEAAQTFLDWQEKDPSNHSFLRYEDIFENNFEQLKVILDKLEIKYPYDLSENKGGHYVYYKPNGDAPKEQPEPTSHVPYRSWQINQPFRNMNTEDKLCLTGEQKDRIRQSEAFRTLYPNIDFFLDLR